MDFSFVIPFISGACCGGVGMVIAVVIIGIMQVSGRASRDEEAASASLEVEE